MKCKDCGCPVHAHIDVQMDVQCEACFSIECSCGSTQFKEQAGLYCMKVVCVKCDRLIEADFTSTLIGLSDEAVKAMGRR